MPKRGKKYQKVVKKVEKERAYLIEDAIKLASKSSYSKFPGSLELHLALNLPSGKDPKSVKGSISLPHMPKKDVVVAVAVPDEMQNTAKEAGADIYDLNTIIKEVKAGKINFDVLIAVPQVMPQLAPLGKALGPKGLMPNPKNGTVVDPKKLKEAVAEFKKGKLLFKADAQGGIHIYVGKVTDSVEDIKENIEAVIGAIVSLIGKGKDTLIKNAYIAPTMGPAVKIDLKSI